MTTLVHDERIKRGDMLIYVFAALVSMLLSIGIDMRETVINPDAICYISSAEAIGRLGIKGAMHLCGQAQWPFYPILVYGLVQLTHFPYEFTAYVIDGIFSLVSVLTFILIVKELGGNRRTLWLAAAVILTAHHFNSVREYIVRDHGFWAFYLLSLFCLLRFVRIPSWFSALSWSICLFAATLFRIEGAVFFLVVPFVSWFLIHVPFIERVKRFLQLNTLLILGGAAGLFLLASHSVETLAFSRVAEVINQLQHGFSLMSERYFASQAGFTQYVLNSDSAKEAPIVFPVMLISWYVVSVAENLSWVYSLLVVYAWRCKAQFFSAPAKKVLTAYLVVAIAITVGFLLEHMFLSKRYLIELSLIFMLWVPFALNDLIEKKQRVLLGFAALFIAVSAAGGIFDFGYSKTYLADAGRWLSDNTSKNAKIYANDYQLMYYSRRFGDSMFTTISTYADIHSLDKGKWKQYDYLALRLDTKEEAKLAGLFSQIHQAPVQTYQNKRGDKVVIYQIKH